MLARRGGSWVCLTRTTLLATCTTASGACGQHWGFVSSSGMAPPTHNQHPKLILSTACLWCHCWLVVLTSSAGSNREPVASPALMVCRQLRGLIRTHESDACRHCARQCCCPSCCRSAEIFDIFTDVFGLDGRAARLRYVVATWGFVCSGWWGTGCGLIATNATLSYGDVASKADVLAIPGYFDCGLGQAPAQEALVSMRAPDPNWPQARLLMVS